ncbi:MAG: hypothetical protein IKR11_12360 [Solobacterium sp.]|nr:hypothetical protein [Solobacterium sp.]
MRIIFVIGPAFSGKSIYIQREFPDATWIKISTFEKHVFEAQSNLEVNQIADNAQLYCSQDLKNRILHAKEDEIIILEHQMLKKKQRAFYLNAVKEVTDTPVECIVMSPTDEMVKKQVQNIEQLFIFYEYDKGKFEMPELDEGFQSIKIERPVKE